MVARMMSHLTTLRPCPTLCLDDDVAELLTRAFKGLLVRRATFHRGGGQLGVVSSLDEDIAGTIAME